MCSGKAGSKSNPCSMYAECTAVGDVAVCKVSVVHLSFLSKVFSFLVYFG